MWHAGTFRRREWTAMRKSWQGKRSQNGKRACIRQSNAGASPCMGLLRVSKPNGESGQIEPREDAEGAEENLGLDDIPRFRMVEWILLAACEERIRGRPLMNGGAGGPRALWATGKACKRKKRKMCKALVAESSVTG